MSDQKRKYIFLCRIIYFFPYKQFYLPMYVHLFFSNLLGAIKSSEWMYIGASKLKNHINPENEPRQVNPKLKATLGAAKWVTSHTVKASGYLVSKAGAATVALGQFLAPHIKNHR